MFLNNQYCYVDMDKTGTVYVNSKLESLNKDYYFKHHEIPSNEIINNQKIIKFGTIRDPWSWYLSLWSYACLNKSMAGVYNNFTRFKPFTSYGNVNNKFLAFLKKQITYINLNLKFNTEDLYSNVLNPNLFRKWLNIVLSDKFIPIVDYPLYHSNLYNYCGLYTKQMIKFYFKNHNINQGIIDLNSGLSEFLEDNCYINDFIDLKHLDSNLKHFFDKYKFHPEQSLTISKRANVSSRNITYYTQETYELVLENEKIMLDYLLKNWKINFYHRIPRFEK